jgi:hypothetical protein
MHASSLSSLQKDSPEKFAMLTAFVKDIRRREILRDAEDIRLFAEMAKVKNLDGKSRRELVPGLLIVCAIYQ